MCEQNSLEARLSMSSSILEDRMGGKKPEVGIILGSGLGSLAEQIEDPLTIPYKEIPHMKSSTAVSHVGQFVCGRLGGKEVICMQGRLHGYEGYTSQEVVYPVRLMERVGIRTLVVSNAVGAVNENYRPGDFCLIADQINFTGRNPVASQEPAALASRFFSMTDAYSPELRRLAREVAEQIGVTLHEGVFLGLLGPSFETPAEIRMFRMWGVDTLAMSVAEEVIAARHLGLDVMGISLVSNMAAGINDASPNEQEVLETAKLREHDFNLLISTILERMQ